MAYYLVHARPTGNITELRNRLDNGEIRQMSPFGQTLDHSLKNAHQQGEQWVWEEEDYCRPPLAMERAAVLDTYFEDITVVRVERGEGWAQIDTLPSAWD